MPRLDVSRILRAERKHERFLAPSVAVRVKPQDATEYEQAFIHDIGDGGIFLRAQRIVPPRSRVALLFLLPSGREVHIEGEVVHVVTQDHVETTKPSGMGIRFVDVSPETGHQIVTEVAPPKIPKLMNHRSIIIVDDDRDTREMLQVVLEIEGFSVKLAANGLRLISALKVDKPAAILLDVRMSWIDGFALCEGLKKSAEFRDIPIMFISARGERADVRQGLSLGAVDYFTKPIDTDRLVARLQEVLGKDPDRAGSDAS